MYDPNELMSFTGSSYENEYTPEELRLLRTIPVSDFNTPGGGPITQKVRNKISTMRGEPLMYPTSTATGIKEAFLNERLSGGELFGDAIPDFDKDGTYIGSDQLIKDYAAKGLGTPSSQLVKLPENNPYAVSGAGY